MGDDTPMSHKGFVYDLLLMIPRPENTPDAVALAQLHATMALVEAVEAIRAPKPEDEVPIEETPEGWLWQRG